MTLVYMRVIRGLESVNLSGVVLTIGNFDGVHRGHQAILSAGRKRADAIGVDLVAMTFDPHPLAVLAPDRTPPLLSPLEEKLRWFEQYGIDLAVLAKSEPVLFDMSAEAFIAEIIVARFQPQFVIEGASFAFGKNRKGNVQVLKQLSPRYSFEVEIVEPIRVTLEDQLEQVVSSSLIRRLLQIGAVDQARLCLGRPYMLLGKVESGAGRGATLGFPTANICIHDQLVPTEGVYAGLARIEGNSYTAAISIGRNATFKGEDTLVEAHLLDFTDDLYDQSIRLELLVRIRQQEAFDSSESLSRQIARDVEQIRTIVAADKASLQS